MRIVVDTNILVAAAYRPGSDSARIVGACLAGNARAIVSPPLVAEYVHILPRAVRPRARLDEWLECFLAHAEMVHPETIPEVVPFDPADDMLFATATSGRADAIVTNDRPLLQLVRLSGVEVLRPSEMVGRLEDDARRRSG